MPFPDELADPLQVVDYRPSWPEEYERFAARIRELLGSVALSVDHVGSTSVPGLAAKDCIDVQVRVESLDDVPIGRLEAAGLRLRPEAWNRVETTYGKENRKLVLGPPMGERRTNLHVREVGSTSARFTLLFRDYLRADGESRRAWGDFKRRLAAAVSDIYAYGQIKAPATEILMRSAERWANETGWTPTVQNQGRPEAM